MKLAPSLAVGTFFLGLSAAASADVPAGYKGLPFDPAVAGGTCVPPTLAAGPYPIPGRLLLPAYDMGGSGVGFNTTDHDTFGGNCFRKDGPPSASLSITSSMGDSYSPNGDVWYDTGDPTLDGTTYPNATTQDVYIGAVRPGDWVNITVNVMQTGTYQVSSTWATGNGPPGGEGGNGAVELQISVNGTMMLDWKDTFPNYMTTANFHDWKPYPNMGTIALQEGVQVFKMLSVDPHLNLDYVQFSLVGADGGVISGGSGGTAGSGSSSSGAASGTSAATGAASGATSATGAGSGSVSSGDTAGSGSVTSGSSTASGAAASGTGGSSGSLTNPGSGVASAPSGSNGSAAGTGGGTVAAASSSTGGSKGCTMGEGPDERWTGSTWVLGMLAVVVARSRRSRSRRAALSQ